MNSNKLTIALVLFILLALVIPAGAEDPNRAPRPNILLIMVDDMGYSDIGCYGGEIETPHLDTLAENGIRFTHFYNNSKCAQSRASLLTGLYHDEVGIKPLNYSATIAELLRDAGYATLMTGKWHQDGTPLDRGWDRFFGFLNGDTYFLKTDANWRLGRNSYYTTDPNFYATDAFTDMSMRFLDEFVEPNQPFFLYIAYNAPHFPLQVPEAEYRKYEDTYKAGWDVLRSQRYQRMLDMGLIDPNWALSPRTANWTKASQTQAPAWNSMSAQRQKEEALMMAAYAGMIDRIDQNIGRLVQKLKDTDQYDNTLILFLSDNGACPWQQNGGTEFDRTKRDQLMPWHRDSYWIYDGGWAHYCNTPFRLHKRYQHEGGTATPMIAHWPNGIQDPNRFEARSSHLIDVLPTCLALAGVDYPKEYNGQEIRPLRGTSLAPIFDGNDVPAQQHLWFRYGNDTNKALITGEWKIVSEDKNAWELYHLPSDRTEMNNLATQEPTLLNSMSRTWSDIKADVQEWPKKPPSTGGRR